MHSQNGFPGGNESPGPRVSVSDVATMVALTYEGPDSEKHHLLEGTSWVRVDRIAVDGENHLRLDIWKNDSLLLYNYAIRGTVALDTWLMDGTVALGNLPAWVGPVRTTIETRLIDAYVKENTERPYQFMVSGHSMGACVADIIAAKCDIPAVTFESTGIDGIKGITEEELANADTRIVGIVGAPNLVNTLHRHRGKVYRAFVPHIWTRREKLRYAAICVFNSAARVFLAASAAGAAAAAMGGAGLLGLPLTAAKVANLVGASTSAGMLSAAASYTLSSRSWIKSLGVQHSMDNIRNFAFSSNKDYTVTDFMQGTSPKKASRLRLRMRDWPRRPTTGSVLSKLIFSPLKTFVPVYGATFSEGVFKLVGQNGGNGFYEHRIWNGECYKVEQQMCGDEDINNAIALCRQRPIVSPPVVKALTESATHLFYDLREELYELPLAHYDERIAAGQLAHPRMGHLVEQVKRIQGQLHADRLALGSLDQTLRTKAEEGYVRLQDVMTAVSLMLGAKKAAMDLADRLRGVEAGQPLAKEVASLKEDCAQKKADMENALDGLRDFALKLRFREAIALLQARLDYCDILAAAAEARQLEESVAVTVAEEVDWERVGKQAAGCCEWRQRLAAIATGQADKTLRQLATNVGTGLSKAIHEYDMRRGILPASVTSAAFGGSGGSAWAVDERPGAGAALTGIRVFSGDCLDGLELQFGHGAGWTSRLGGRGGSQEPGLLELARGEEIIAASVFADSSRVYGFEFTTSSRRTVRLGNLGSKRAEWHGATPAPKGAYRLAEFSGRSGLWMDQISLVWRLRESITTGPFGGDGGKPWTEVNEVGPVDAPLTGLRVHFSDSINAIQAEYGDVWGPCRGGRGGNKSAVLKLAPGEEIISVNVITGKVARGTKVVLQLEVATSDRRTVVLGPVDAATRAGNSDTRQDSATPEGPSCAYRLKGLHGREGFLVDQLSFVWEPRTGLSAQQPKQQPVQQQ